MKTIAKTTAQIIGKTQDEYEAKIFHFWWNYCRSKTSIDAELQQLLINVPLNNWFITEINRLEKEALIQLKPYIGTTNKKDLMVMWRTELLGIFHLHSYTLINAAKDLAPLQWKPQYN